MALTLYKDDVQARRVTDAAQQALASTDDTLYTQTTFPKRHLHVPIESWAGPLSLMSMYNALQYTRTSTHNTLLHNRAVELVEAPCQRQDIPIQTLGEYPLFRGVKLVRGAISDVVIVPADEDPLFATGKFPLPQQVRKRLRAIEDAGVPFDMLYTYIAHEIPRNTLNADGPLPIDIVIPPVPAHTVQISQRLGVVGHTLTVGLLKQLGHIGLGTARSVGTATLSAGAATAALLDPLIFGAIADERNMATWFVLAQWAW